MNVESAREQIASEIELLNGELESRPSANFLDSFVFQVATDGRASSIHSKGVNILTTIDRNSFGDWPSFDIWKEILPSEFVRRFRNPLTKAQADEWLKWWRQLPSEEQMKAEFERVWSLDGWLYWMEPKNRTWFWQTSEVIDDCHVKITLKALEWPFPWGSFRWLFLGVGAKDVTPD